MKVQDTQRITPLGLMQSYKWQVADAKTPEDKANMALLLHTAEAAFARTKGMQSDARVRAIKTAATDRMRQAVLAGDWQYDPNHPYIKQTMEEWANLGQPQERRLEDDIVAPEMFFGRRGKGKSLSEEEWAKKP
jgi:hypothetical protein